MPVRNLDEKPKKRCENCDYSYREFEYESASECRRHAPMLVVPRCEHDSGGAMWPEVDTFQRACGGWKPEHDEHERETGQD